MKKEANAMGIHTNKKGYFKNQTYVLLVFTWSNDGTPLGSEFPELQKQLAKIRSCCNHAMMQM
jgi:hypothetical protein